MKKEQIKEIHSFRKAAASFLASQEEQLFRLKLIRKDLKKQLKVKNR